MQLRVSGGYQIERLGEQMGDVSTESSCKYPFSLWSSKLPGEPGFLLREECISKLVELQVEQMSLFWKKKALGHSKMGWSRNP